MDPNLVEAAAEFPEARRRPDGNLIERRVILRETLRGIDILYVHVGDPD